MRVDYKKRIREQEKFIRECHKNYFSSYYGENAREVKAADLAYLRCMKKLEAND